MTGRALVLRGDARALPLPDACVDLIVTSPPYYALRSYTDGGEHYDGQIGSEATPAAYIDALIDCTREWARVLRPGGSMFVDLGDKYSGAQGQSNGGLAPGGAPPSGSSADVWARTDPRRTGIPNKSLMLLPERYRIAAVDRLGLICRAVIVWAKPNGLPESVQDRVRRSHEDWVHLVKAPRYYSAIDEIREAYSPDTAARYALGFNLTGVAAAGQSRNAKIAKTDGGPSSTNPLGKLPGSVWTIPTEPLTVPAGLGVDHFAAYPTEWPRRLILGWSPPGICVQCGEGRRPVADAERTARPTSGPLRGGANRTKRDGHPGTDGDAGNMMTLRTITGYVCACTPYTDHPERQQPTVTPSRSKGRGHQDNDTRAEAAGSRRHGNDWPFRYPIREYHFDQWTPAPTRPAVVLDPFGGTGTTALVAAALGRVGISVDMSADYCRLAAWRTTDRRQIAAAMRVTRPDPVAPDQLDLF